MRYSSIKMKYTLLTMITLFVKKVPEGLKNIPSGTFIK